MPSGGMRPPIEAELVHRVAWLIRLRWLAPVTILVMTLLARLVLGLAPSWPRMVAIASFVALYNSGLTCWWAQLQRRSRGRLQTYNLLANSQVAADWLTLTLLLHWTGGIESPLSPYYLLHVVVACVLLSPRAATLQATLASLLLAGLAGLEYTGVLSHQSLLNYLPVSLYDRPAYLVAVLFFFTTTLYVCVFLATGVTRSLRHQHAELLALQSHQEDLYRRTRALYETAILLSGSLRLDEVLDERMLTNLVDNTIKYTLRGGQAWVRLQRDGNRLVLTVADTGIGIPDEALGHIFEEFYRAPNARASEKEGTGLGLAIAKQVIHEHEGHIDVQSQVGVGTTFTITLPTTPPPVAVSSQQGG